LNRTRVLIGYAENRSDSVRRCRSPGSRSAHRGGGRDMVSKRPARLVGTRTSGVVGPGRRSGLPPTVGQGHGPTTLERLRSVDVDYPADEDAARDLVCTGTVRRRRQSMAAAVEDSRPSAPWRSCRRLPSLAVNPDTSSRFAASTDDPDSLSNGALPLKWRPRLHHKQ
jgi:hypothetical protein